MVTVAVGRTVMTNEIIRHKLSLLSPGGERTPLEIAVGAPYSCQDDPDENITCWYGPVQIKGLRDKVHEIGAEDPFEALVLSIMFVRRMLLGMKRNGCRVVFPDTDEDYPIEEIFDTGDYQQSPGAHSSKVNDDLTGNAQE